MATKISHVLAEARATLRHQPTGVRVRAEWAGLTVLDTTGAHLVWEPRRVLCQYAVPEADLATVALEPTVGRPVSPPAEGFLGPDVGFAGHTTTGEVLDVVLGKLRAEQAAFRPADPDLAGLVLLDFDALDGWWHEDEQVVAHPRDPFHRVDALPSRRRVRVGLDGEVLADTRRAVAVNETGFPLRWYVPREDVRVDLAPTTTRTACPYKGVASYWAAAGVDDVAWSYEDPCTEVAPIASHLCFDDATVDIHVEA